MPAILLAFFVILNYLCKNIEFEGIGNIADNQNRIFNMVKLMLLELARIILIVVIWYVSNQLFDKKDK